MISVTLLPNHLQSVLPHLVSVSMLAAVSNEYCNQVAAGVFSCSIHATGGSRRGSKEAVSPWQLPPCLVSPPLQNNSMHVWSSLLACNIRLPISFRLLRIFASVEYVT